MVTKVPVQRGWFVTINLNKRTALSAKIGLESITQQVAQWSQLRDYNSHEKGSSQEFA